MASDEVRIARDGGVMTLTLDRPDDQNRLTADVIATLRDTVDRLAVDDEIQAVEGLAAHREGRPPRFLGR